MFIALTIASIVFLGCYLVASFIIFKKNNGEKINLANHFGYELFLSKKREYFSLNSLLFVAAGILIANNLIYAIKFYNVNTVIACILSVAAMALFVATNIIPLNKLREHLICSLLSFSLLATSALCFLLNFLNIYKLELNNLYFISVVIEILALIIGVVAMFFPNLTNLNMNVDHENKLIRPKVIYLALFEWIGMFALFISQIGFVVASMI